jgi:hypothetical protein
MNFLPTTVPLWVSISFIFAFPIFIFMIANAAKSAAINAKFEAQKADTIYRTIVIFCMVYFIYTALMSFTGIFQVNAIPPRILLFTAIPLLLFLFLVVFRTKIYWTLLENATLESLIRLHIFRFIGVYFLIATAYAALPQSFALIAGIGDIFVAFTAIFVANTVEKRKSYSHKLALLWNIIGFWDIVSVVVTAVLVTKNAIASGSSGILEMTYFPFSWIAAFAPASIIFLHITIFKRLKTYKLEIESK